MLDLIVLHGEFSIFTVRGNFWYQIYRNRRKKVLCSRLSLITLTNITRDHVSSPFIPLVYTPAVHHEVIIPLHLRDDLLPSQRKRPTIGWWENNRTEKRSDPNVKEQ